MHQEYSFIALIRTANTNRTPQLNRSPTVTLNLGYICCEILLLPCLIVENE